MGQATRVGKGEPWDQARLTYDEDLEQLGYEQQCVPADYRVEGGRSLSALTPPCQGMLPCTPLPPRPLQSHSQPQLPSRSRLVPHFPRLVPTFGLVVLEVQVQQLAHQLLGTSRTVTGLPPPATTDPAGSGGWEGVISASARDWVVGRWGSPGDSRPSGAPVLQESGAASCPPTRTATGGAAAASPRAVGRACHLLVPAATRKGQTPGRARAPPGGGANRKQQPLHQ